MTIRPLTRSCLDDATLSLLLLQTKVIEDFLFCRLAAPLISILGGFRRRVAIKSSELSDSAPTSSLSKAGVSSLANVANPSSSSRLVTLTCKVARWQNLIPSFPWIAPGWRAWGHNPRKERDQILQRSHSPEARRAKHI